MRYIPLTDDDRRKMLEAAGVASVDELFEQIPEKLRLGRPLDVPGPLGELDVERQMGALARENLLACLSFVGAGVYQHHIPARIAQIALRSEFLTAYTPYQPEISQGTLQAVFEFQTMISELTGLPVANASLYDGSTATAEAMLMAHRVNGRRAFVLPKTLHPEYRQVCHTYATNMNFRLLEPAWREDGTADLHAAIEEAGSDLSAVLIQSPNFFGCLEDWSEAAALAHARGALAVAVTTEALALALVASPGSCGCDIAVGEAQSFGVPVSFGGPYLGYMAAADSLVRSMPGRLVGQTVDRNGRRGFVLTLATREQHIRREKATSNICTNEGLCALMATIYLSTLGKQGLRDLAALNLSVAAHARKVVTRSRKLKLPFAARSFNEFTVQLPVDAGVAAERLQARGIIPGVPLGDAFPELSNCLLICCTEAARREDIESLMRELEAL